MGHTWQKVRMSSELSLSIGKRVQVSQGTMGLAGTCDCVSVEYEPMG